MKEDLAGGKLVSGGFGQSAAWWAIMILAFHLNSAMKHPRETSDLTKMPWIGNWAADFGGRRGLLFHPYWSIIVKNRW